ncbi:hypothetical protein KO516_04635 [Citreicella sp. C3M06]|nr:hypothetical protein [Salipiger sp. 1_MG-2023]MBU2960127.1 hypothetical protein [Citreicella sp. C3M06]MDO6586041.1 hypothetical protein [Salipiger sp. 1_MG-2023]
MILIHLEDDMSQLENEREQIALTLKELGEEIRRLKAQIEEGEATSKTETGKLMSDVRYWMRASHETEAQIANVRRKQKGLAGDWALDLERARDEIGCRMARLRRCCGAGSVPE